jgi:cell wall-associated NlpC family hydrolase
MTSRNDDDDAGWAAVDRRTLVIALARQVTIDPGKPAEVLTVAGPLLSWMDRPGSDTEIHARVMAVRLHRKGIDAADLVAAGLMGDGEALLLSVIAYYAALAPDQIAGMTEYTAYAGEAARREVPPGTPWPPPGTPSLDRAWWLIEKLAGAVREDAGGGWVGLIARACEYGVSTPMLWGGPAGPEEYDVLASMTVTELAGLPRVSAGPGAPGYDPSGIPLDPGEPGRG